MYLGQNNSDLNHKVAKLQQLSPATLLTLSYEECQDMRCSIDGVNKWKKRAGLDIKALFFLSIWTEIEDSMKTKQRISYLYSN